MSPTRQTHHPAFCYVQTIPVLAPTSECILQCFKWQQLQPVAHTCTLSGLAHSMRAKDDCREFMRSTTPESELPSIKECTYLVARCTVNNHTISDDALFGHAPGGCSSRFPHATCPSKHADIIHFSSR